jgi:hypothetical protein
MPLAHHERSLEVNRGVFCARRHAVQPIVRRRTAQPAADSPFAGGKSYALRSTAIISLTVTRSAGIKRPVTMSTAAMGCCCNEARGAFRTAGRIALVALKS